MIPCLWGLQKKGFKLKIEDTLVDYLSCNIKIDLENGIGWIHQPNLIKKLELTFGDLVKNLPFNYKTPGTPGKSIIRGIGKRVEKEEQSLYRTGVGMLLYLIKYSRPDISNPIRELSKVVDGATEAAFKELKRNVNFILKTKKLGLKLKPRFDERGLFWIEAYSDSDYATDTETRKSVTGFIIYFCGVPVSWCSRSQRSVTLSSSEAEYIALSETAKEIVFLYQLVIEMGLEVKLPITVRVDNIGAMFMAENIAVSGKTKHVQIRYRFVNDLIEEGFLEVVFVGTLDNDADLFTKNVKGDLYEEHSKKIVHEMDELD